MHLGKWRERLIMLEKSTRLAFGREGRGDEL
jgi:hypothetical protein